MTTAQDFAARLDGSQYRREGSRALWAEMKAAGCVAIFGASDDLMEIRGAEDDEIGAYSGGTVSFTRKGLLKNECEEDDCPYHARLQKQAVEVEAIWDRDGFSWIYDTAIPHATFVVQEDGLNYCRGIVFALADVPSPPAQGGENVG